MIKITPLAVAATLFSHPTADSTKVTPNLTEGEHGVSNVYRSNRQLVSDCPLTCCPIHFSVMPFSVVNTHDAVPLPMSLLQASAVDKEWQIADDKEWQVADVGVLKARRTTGKCSFECQQNSVKYCDGYTPPFTCGTQCCSGTDACEGFTGCVEKDGSCTGDRACMGANIGLVKASCKGHEVCNYVGRIDSVINSCNYGNYACKYASYSIPKDDSKIGSIENSCNNGDSACYETANYGNIGLITNSCNGKEACKNAASKGSIDSVEESCNAPYACQHLAAWVPAGSIDSVEESCNAPYACQYLYLVPASLGGTVIRNCCNTDAGCTTA